MRPQLMALCLEALAFILVPSSATRPSFSAPASSASRKTCWKSCSSASRWILRKSEIVRKSGWLPAASTRNGTSSTSRWAILREERTPRQ